MYTKSTHNSFNNSNKSGANRMRTLTFQFEGEMRNGQIKNVETKMRNQSEGY